MRYLDKRVQVICEQLKKISIVKTKSIENIYYKKGKFLYPKEAEKGKEPWETFEPTKMKWYGPDGHYWFKTKFTVPKDMENKNLRIHLKTQIEEWDDGKNPQFLIFINNEVKQGLDMNHRTLQLTHKAVENESYDIEFQAYTGTLHSEFDLILEIQEVDLQIEKLYFDLLVPLQAFPRMNEEDRSRMDLEYALNETVNLLDLRTPYSDEFYESLNKAIDYIDKNLYEKMGGHDEVVATCIGHTHIDVAWWWTVEQTREKVARSFATVLKLMEEYPNYKFMSSQPQLYEFLKERYPELYSQIKARVKEGRWEIEGGMWVEADTNLTSGESLVRQFLYGKKFFKDEFGFNSEVLWLPDVFGYSGALPQIMDKCGIKYFMTTKLAWNQYNKMPYDTFEWKGIDGTGIFTHLVTTLDVGQSEENFFTTYNGRLHPDSIMGGWNRYQNKDINNDILISYGYGDGGGGPTREMLETSIRLEKGIKGVPKVRQEFAGKYFEELYDRVSDNKRLPTWSGELYFEYHRGTYTSMARNKRSNRKSEIMMMDLEFLSTIASFKGKDYPKTELDSMWKVILINQFHDILPGTSIKEVYEVTKKEYDEIAKKGENLLNETLSTIVDDKNSKFITIYNTLGFRRDDVVKLPKDCEGSLVDADGMIYPIQKTEEGSIAYLKNIPSKGYKTFEIVNNASSEEKFKISDNILETPFYTVNINSNGYFTSIYDKVNDREVVQENKKANLFVMYEDKPMYYDNWDIDVYYTEKKWVVDSLVNKKWTEKGQVCVVLEQEFKVSNSTIIQKIYFYADTQRIDFETYVDWKEHQHLLKVHFPVDIHTDEATFDVQFGDITRKTHTNTSWDVARFESCGQKWVDLSEGHYGVSLLNDCKYGHSVSDSNIALTLIKSGIEPNPTTDQEEHYFTYSLYPHNGNLRESDTIQEGYKVNYPAYNVFSGKTCSEDYFVQSLNKNIIIETIKIAEDKNGVIIRLYESENTKTKGKLIFGMGRKIVSIEECNLIEEKLGETISVNDSEYSFTIKPYEIKSYRVTLA